jgi:uncharacterized membrane protein YgcG
MIKSVTLISVAVTTVVLLTMAGVVYAYNGLITTKPKTLQPANPNSQDIALPVAASVPADNPDISPQDAASIAIKFSNRTDLYSEELADFNGSQVYKLTFASGDAIYVDLKGQVVGSTPPSQAVVASPTTQPPPAVIYTGPVKKHASGHSGDGSGGTSSSGGGSGEHDGGGGGDD